MNSFRFSSFWASICAAIMGLLGFSCSNDEDMALMYGTPIADFEIKGVVFTEKGNKPVPDAVIKVMEVPVPDPYFPEEDITDREGGTTEAGILGYERAIQLHQHCPRRGR